MAAATPSSETALPVPGPPAATSPAVSACGGARPCSPGASLSSDIRASCSRPPLGGRALRGRLRLGLLFVAPGPPPRGGLFLPCARVFPQLPVGGICPQV